MPSLVDCKWPLEHLEICIHVTHQFTDIPIPTLGDRERVSGFHLTDTSEKRSFSSSPASLCKPISVCLNVLIILSFNSCFSGMVIKVKLRALLDSIFLGKNKDKNRKHTKLHTKVRKQGLRTSCLRYSCLENGQRSLAGCNLWGHKESDMTEWTNWVCDLR